jgi:hypothetical protein
MAEPELIDGRYRLERVLGADGSDQSWLAHDQVLDRRVVVRVLPTDRRADAAAAAAFGAAVRDMARAGTVEGRRVLDAGDDAAAGTPFAVLEWVGDEPVGVAPDLGATRPIPRAPAPAAAPSTAAAQPVAASPRVRRRRRGRRLPIWPAVLVLGIVAIAVGLRLAPANHAVDTGSAGPGAATSAPAAAPTSTPAPTRPAVTATASVAGQRRKIANTDGQGVALRARPGGDRLPGHGYDEGDMVTLLEQSGQWAHIRGDDGREGWVLAVTLVPVGASSG